jgi:RecA-family ATPase
MLFGNSKVGKSKLAIDLAFCVAKRNSCFLEQKTKQGKVLIISSDSLQSLRHSLTHRGFSTENAENIRFIRGWGIDEIGLLVTHLEDF